VICIKGIEFARTKIEKGDLPSIRDLVGQVCRVIEPLIRANEKKDRAIEQKDALASLQKFADSKEDPVTFVREIRSISEYIEAWYLILNHRDQTVTGVVEPEWQWVLMDILIGLTRAVKAISNNNPEKHNECIADCGAYLLNAVLYRLPHLKLCLPKSLLEQ